MRYAVTDREAIDTARQAVARPEAMAKLRGYERTVLEQLANCQGIDSSRPYLNAVGRARVILWQLDGGQITIGKPTTTLRRSSKRWRKKKKTVV